MLSVVNAIDNTCQPFVYRGEDCLDHFVNPLTEIKEDIFSRMKESKKMDISIEQETEFKKASRCSICEKNFKAGDKKVRDHCHFTGEYRGATRKM